MGRRWNMTKLLKSKYSFFIFIIAIILLAGGLLGIVKRLIPGLEGWGFNAIIGLQGKDDRSAVIVTYSIALAVLEILSSIGLLMYRKFGLKLVMVTLSISAAGSLVSIIIGDMGAVFSLAVRAAGIVFFSYKTVRTEFS